MSDDVSIPHADLCSLYAEIGKRVPEFHHSYAAGHRIVGETISVLAERGMLRAVGELTPDGLRERIEAMRPGRPWDDRDSIRDAVLHAVLALLPPAPPPGYAAWDWVAHPNGTEFGRVLPQRDWRSSDNLQVQWTNGSSGSYSPTYVRHATAEEISRLERTAPEPAARAPISEAERREIELRDWIEVADAHRAAAEVLAELGRSHATTAPRPTYEPGEWLSVASWETGLVLLSQASDGPSGDKRTLLDRGRGPEVWVRQESDRLASAEEIAAARRHREHDDEVA